ncbi:MAG: hypothetical protein ABI601_16115 [bacterium]
MSPGLADVPRNVKSPAKSPKNTFDRDPLLIPQLFVSGKPWYRRPWTVVKVILLVILLVVMAYAAHRYGIRALKVFARLVGK